jgi:YVTN family beta-propeller protein
MKKVLALLMAILIFSDLIAQPYTTANAHSHNDYEQNKPFTLAFNELFGSIEADIFLSNGSILVGHNLNDLKPNRSLENLYLAPMVAYNPTRKLQLLIDIKTEAITTLNALVDLLKKYPSIINNKNIRIVISGNAPKPSEFAQYPDFIWFDGRINTDYTKEQLQKIALLSGDYGNFVVKRRWPLLPEDLEKMQAAINRSHGLEKPIRFWASPDFKDAWEQMITLKVDYINTDKINELSDYLVARNSALRELPYNRIIKSAGEVVRYGKPSLENHALDIANLSDKNLVVVEERYGVFVLDILQNKVVDEWRFEQNQAYKGMMSTYSGIKTITINEKEYVLWSAATGNNSAIMIAEWKQGFKNVTSIAFEKKSPAKNALPNQVEVVKEDNQYFIYVVLNGNNELIKLNWDTRTIVWKTNTGVAPFGLAVSGKKIFVTNWAGETVIDSSKSTAGVPWGLAYTSPITGATASGTISVFNTSNGKLEKEITVGLHPNAIIASADGKYIYVANGSSDEITVINAKNNQLIENIFVGMAGRNLQGSTPNGLSLSVDGKKLYVSNGLDNAIAIIHLGKSSANLGTGKTVVEGFIPTEAYPAGLLIKENKLIVANLESDGANVIDEKRKARTIHQELASVSIIPLPDQAQLKVYTNKVKEQNLLSRLDQLLLPARPNLTPVPIPERIGEPSVFKHVVYIIKENKTYDQVLGDVKNGNGDSSLCVFGEKYTPNTHALVKQFGGMDNFHASGKSSAEGHQWTDAGMVSDYVEKNVRAWFRSYPHRQEDALVYNKAGFIWNHALTYGKKVRVFGEACETEYDKKLNWFDIYKQYEQGIKPTWYNTTTIDNLNSIISPTFPDCDNLVFSDQQRASIFMEEWNQLAAKDSLPNLMVVSLPNDHTAGTSPNFPTPYSMVADNDLALGRIVDMITKSKYWDSTVIFVTEDDSQGGWDHVSAYRTVGMVISPYTSNKMVHTKYNQVSMLRTIEQILGIPPMNSMDATSRLMTDCFQTIKNNSTYTMLPNRVPLDEKNKPLSSLKGIEKKYAEISQNEVFNEVDGGEDDMMNKILWYYVMGAKKYPTTVNK